MGSPPSCQAEHQFAFSGYLSINLIQILSSLLFLVQTRTSERTRIIQNYFPFATYFVPSPSPVMAKQETTKTDTWGLFIRFFQGLYGYLAYFVQFITGFIFLKDPSTQQKKLDDIKRPMERFVCAKFLDRSQLFSAGQIIK